MTRDTDVLLEKRRRDAERGRDVVEAVDLDLRGQELGGVDLDADERLDRGRVLRAVQTLDRNVPCARHHRVSVDRALEPRDQRVDVLLIGLRPARRRHQASAQLTNGHLEDLGMRGYGLGAEALEHRSARGFGRVVALDAVGLDQRPLLLGAVAEEAGAMDYEGGDTERKCAGSGDQKM